MTKSRTVEFRTLKSGASKICLGEVRPSKIYASRVPGAKWRTHEYRARQVEDRRQRRFGGLIGPEVR